MVATKWLWPPYGGHEMAVATGLLEDLNPVQREAVTHPGGPLLIVAGAGSGKTRVLTHRIAWLIKEQGISPFEILAITFTNKAADEVKSRVEALVGRVAQKMWVSTFHSACVRILRRDAQRLGYKSSFTIYDQADAERLTTYVLRDLNIDPKRFPPRSGHAVISQAKNDLLEFEEAFPASTLIVLEQNYRSTQTILDAANAVIANNLMRKPKALWTEQVGGELIERYFAEDEHDEARWLVQEVHRLHDEAYRWGDVAVFYRTNAQSRVVEEELVRADVPYRVIGGTRFYERREVKDALAYLRALINPTDEVSLKRIVNVPKRGVGDTSLGRIDAWAASHGATFAEALDHAEEAGVHGRALTGVRELVDLLEELRAVDDGPRVLLEAILTRTGYTAELVATRSLEAQGRLGNP